MHKIIRQVALHDSAYKHLVKTDNAMQKSTNKIHWLEKNWISLIDNELQTDSKKSKYQQNPVEIYQVLTNSSHMSSTYSFSRIFKNFSNLC